MRLRLPNRGHLGVSRIEKNTAAGVPRRRYDSGAKEFKQLSTERLGSTCDAVTLHPRFYRVASARQAR